MDYKKNLDIYREREIKAYQSLDLDEVSTVINVLEKTRQAGNRVFTCGNGGSASTAGHYVGDFNKGVNLGLLGIDAYNKTENNPNAEKMQGIPLYNFECLSDNISTVMAVSNDESYSEAFRFPLSVKMKKGDVLIGISGSGNSTNVLNAFDYAKKYGGTTIAIVGFSGGKMKQIADYCIHVDVNDMQITEDIHMILGHMMMWVLTQKDF